jgi:GT2 family glycosyltransferase
MVPNYNGAEFLRVTIPALLGQTYPDVRVVVVDNRSTDDSLAVLRGFRDPRLRVVPADDHVPIMANFNRTLALADTPACALCASDEVYEPDWVATLLPLLEAHPEAFAATPKCDSADADGRVYLSPQERYKDTFWPPDDPCAFAPSTLAGLLLRGNFLVLTTVLFRTSVLRELGPFNDRYQFVADWEYWFRGAFAGYSIVGSHRRLAHYRRHAGMTTRKLNANLSRFGEEAELCRWAAEQCHARGWRPSADPDYGLVNRSLLSEFAALLAAGATDPARRLFAYGCATIPGFRSTLPGVLARTALSGGRTGGRALRALEWGYLRLLTRLR